MTTTTIQNSSVLFSNAADSWKEKLRNSALSASTIKTYESVLMNKIMPRLENRSLADISRQECEKIIRESSLSGKSLRTVWTVLCCVLKHAYEKNLLSEKINWPFPKNSGEMSQVKLEKGIQQNDLCALMSVMLRENISMSNLLALSKNDVNEKSGTITIKNKMLLHGDSFVTKQEHNISEVSVSDESMAILLGEISKHSALEKKFPETYSNPENLIFTDQTGSLLKPSYCAAKFMELSRSVGFSVTPKNLAEFGYIKAAENVSEKTVTSNGKKYTYLKSVVKTDFGRKEIFARSLAELQKKYLMRNDRYAYNLTKNETAFADHCRSELDSMDYITVGEKEKISAMLQKYLDPFSRNFTVNQIDDDFQNGFMKYLESQKCTYSAKKRITKFLRDICKTAASRNYIRYNPFADVYIKPDKPIKYHALSDEEVKMIMTLDSGNINNAFLQVMLLTGMRTAEALGLCWKDVSDDGKHITICRQLRYGENPVLVNKTKNYKPRTITPPSLTFEILEKHRDATSNNENNAMNLVFCSENGKPLNPGFLHKKLKSIVGRNNVRLHDLRVTAITTIYRKTGNLALASSEAGHSDSNITERHYVDVNPDLSTVKSVQDEYYSEILSHE